jgi:FkbM family methyltransferase
MKRKDRIKLDFTRNWKLPGKERLSNWLKPSAGLKTILKDGITWLTNEDIAIFTTADNYIEWSLLSSGTYEDEINKLIRISLKPGDNALDIGGNIGLQSIRMAQCVGDAGIVYSFEPLAYLQEKFKRNLSLNRATCVTLFPYALSDSEGEADFRIDHNLWNQGTFSLSSKGDGPETQRVLIKVADQMTEIQTLNSLALIKIDVEGFEYQVLRGLKQTLAKHKPRIIFEYDSNYWDKTEQKIDDCYAFLQSLNYSLYQINSIGCELIKNEESISSGNLFCIPA